MSRIGSTRDLSQVDCSDDYKYTQSRWIMMESRWINDLTQRILTREYLCSVDVMPDPIGGILDLVIQSNSQEELKACDQKTVSEVISFCEQNNVRRLWIGS